MTDKDAPLEGMMFRRNYLRPEVPLADSPRARLRLAQYFRKSIEYKGDNFANTVQDELGIEYPFSHRLRRNLHEVFWQSAQIGDALSAITLWFGYSDSQREFIWEVRRIFSEEHLRYRLDDKGGVHFLVDEEFERTVASVIEGLGATRFAASHHALQEGLSALGTMQQSGKALIRGVFEAVESAFLVVIAQPSADRLNAAAVDKHLKPLLLERYASYGDAGDMVDRLLEHFKAWVKSAHPFRHGTPLEQIHEAPLDLAIMSATQGMGYLRLLTSL